MVKIITDTTAALPQEVADQRRIPVIPQIVSFGEKSYYEGRDIDTAMFMKLSNPLQFYQRQLPRPQNYFLRSLNV